MIIGLGIDLCEIRRIESAISDHARFEQRIYTDVERAAIAEKGAQTAAGFFAAKEAVAKALGGFFGFGFADISIEAGPGGQPRAVLSGGALDRLRVLGGTSVHLSITHDGGMAAAVAVVE